MLSSIVLGPKSQGSTHNYMHCFRLADWYFNHIVHKYSLITHKRVIHYRNLLKLIIFRIKIITWKFNMSFAEIFFFYSMSFIIGSNNAVGPRWYKATVLCVTTIFKQPRVERMCFSCIGINSFFIYYYVYFYVNILYIFFSNKLLSLTSLMIKWKHCGHTLLIIIIVKI